MTEARHPKRTINALSFLASCVLLLPLGGCRDVVTKVDGIGVDVTGKSSFQATPGASYVVWSDYDIETSDRDDERYCYELQTEFRQGDKTIKQSCWPFRTTTCASVDKLGSAGDCKTDCKASFSTAGDVSVEAKLVNTGKKCVSKGAVTNDVTCGLPRENCRQALKDKSHLKAYSLQIVKD